MLVSDEPKKINVFLFYACLSQTQKLKHLKVYHYHRVTVAPCFSFYNTAHVGPQPLCYQSHVCVCVCVFVQKHHCVIGKISS